MTFGDQMKQKADEVHLQDKAKDFGDALSEVVKAALGMASSYAAENRPKVDGMLDKAEAKIGEKAGPKHAETITKARSTVDHGLDKMSEKAAQTSGKPSTHTPEPNPWATPPTATVPPDTTSAFDEEGPAGSPS